MKAKKAWKSQECFQDQKGDLLMREIVLGKDLKNVTERDVLQKLKLPTYFRIAVSGSVLMRNERISLKKGEIIWIIEPIQ